jgi:HlyD family secretion protein
MRHRIIPLVLVLTLVAGYAGYQWWRARDADSGRLTAAGMLQGDQVAVAAEVAGRVTQVLVRRGDAVERGQVLVRLDDAELRRRFRLAPSGSPEQQLLQLQLDKLELKAPIAGIIAERAVEPGEVAVPGAPLLIVERLDVVELVMYVSERQIGRVALGQLVTLTTDSFPGRTFTGRVDYISPRAEFTPRNVQAPEDRALLVFAVRAQVSNPDHALKPGMPVDAILAEAAPAS